MGVEQPILFEGLRRPARPARLDNTRQRLDLLHDLAVELARLRRRIPLLPRIDRQQQHVVGPKADIDRRCLLPAPNEQTRGDEQHE